MSENLNEKQITEVQRAIDHLKENGFKEEAAQAQKMLDNSKSRVWRMLGSTFVYDKTPPKEDLLAVTYGGPVNGIFNNGHITLRSPFFDSYHDGPIENLTDEQKVRLRAKTLIHELEHLNSQANVSFRSRLADWIRDTEYGPREKHLSSLNQLGYTKEEIQKIKDKYNEDPVLVKHVPVIDKELLKPKPLPKDESEEAAKPPQKNLVSIAVSPKSAELSVGGSQHFSATAIYSDSSTNNITGLVQWAGGDGNSFTAKKGGTFILNATYQGISGSATIIVKKLPTVLVVSPAQKTIKINETAGFTAKVTFDDGSAEDVTGKAGWAPMNPFSGTAAGAYTITASYENVSGSAAVTVQKTLKAVSLAPAERTIKISESASFTATAIFDDGSTYDVTGEAIWSPGSSFAGTKAGTFIIAANYKGLSGKARITVAPKDSVSGGYDPRKDPNIPKDKTQVDIPQVDILGEEFQKDTGKKPDKDKDKSNAPLTPYVPQPPDYTAGSGTKTDETTQPPYPPYGPSPSDRTGQGKDWTKWATGPKPQSGIQSTTQPTTQPHTQSTGQSTTQPATKPPATGGSTPAPVDTRTVACSTTTKSGSNTPATITVKVSKAPGIAKFSYTMFTVKDRMIVQYGGQTLYDTGCVSGSKTVSLNLSGASDSVIVTVQPECEKKESTQWNFTLECPKPATR